MFFKQASETKKQVEIGESKHEGGPLIYSASETSFCTPINLCCQLRHRTLPFVGEGDDEGPWISE